MNVNIEIKVKMDKGKELVLKGDEAKELYLKLKEIYEDRVVKEYVLDRWWYPDIYKYPTGTNAPHPDTYPPVWVSSGGTYSVNVQD